MPAPAAPPLPRTLRADDYETARPIFAVWELTLKCDQPCTHCGSRAGPARTDELDTEESLRVVRELAELGCREVAIIGGEAYLRPDLLQIVEAFAKAGVRPTMQTGGRAMTRERVAALAAAGLEALGVSIDGDARAHDRLRGNLGSHAAALAALDAARDAGLVLACNTQVNRLSAGSLRRLSVDLRARRVQTWQVVLTVPMGRAADHPEWLLQPWEVVPVIDELAAIQREAAAAGEAFNVFAGNNIGYYGPHEALLRGRPGGGDAYWKGCRAGMNLIGVESDGTVKACPSLPTAPYAGGNVRDAPLAELWAASPELRFSRDRDASELWGFCKTCYYADTCRAGCSWTAHSIFGKRGNFPHCYHRVTQLRRKGLRERIVRVEAARGQPYDTGRFELVEEPWQDDEGEPLAT